MKKFAWALTLALFATSAYANGPWKREFQDINLPSQEMLEHQTWVGPVLGTTTFVKGATAQSSGVALTISSFSAQPDYARNITLSPGLSTGSVGAGTAIVTGLNIFGKAISENFTISSGQSTVSTGSKAFKSVSSVVIPASTGANVQWTVGIGNKLGVKSCLDRAGDYLASELNSVYDASRGTMAVDPALIESNTFQSSGTLDGVKAVDLLYFQNFRCYGN